MNSRSRRTRATLTLSALLLCLFAGCTGGVANGGPTASPTPSDFEFASTYRLPAEYAEWEAAYQSSLELLANNRTERGLGPPPTDATFVRFIKPDEYGVVYAECMVKQGFAASESFDGGLLPGNLTEDQVPAFEDALFRCNIQYPVHPKYQAKLTEVQTRLLYEYYVNELVPCLNREGYPIDPGEVPTWERFLATFGTKEAWLPYLVYERKDRQVTEANGGIRSREQQAEFERIMTVCPGEPPLDRLYPEDE